MIVCYKGADPLPVVKVGLTKPLLKEYGCYFVFHPKSVRIELFGVNANVSW